MTLECWLHIVMEACFIIFSAETSRMEKEMRFAICIVENQDETIRQLTNWALNICSEPGYDSNEIDMKIRTEGCELMEKDFDNFEHLKIRKGRIYFLGQFGGHLYVRRIRSLRALLTLLASGPVKSSKTSA